MESDSEKLYALTQDLTDETPTAFAVGVFVLSFFVEKEGTFVDKIPQIK